MMAKNICIILLLMLCVEFAVQQSCPEYYCLNSAGIAIEDCHKALSACRDEMRDWNGCSKTCGGGTQSRQIERWCYCTGEYVTGPHDIQCFNSPWWPLRTETRGCNEICYNGGTFSGSSCNCQDGYYDSCCLSACPQIKWCDKYWCNAPPSTCTQCDAYGGLDMAKQAYWLNQNQCWPRCNWLDHWCFPGRCNASDQYLATTCQCDPGFKMETPNEMTTKCQLEHPPKVETCRSGIEDDLGNVFNSTFDGPTTSCDHTIDTYVNIKPDELSMVFDFSLRLPQDPPSGAERHEYIHDFLFGIVGAGVSLKHYQKSGAQTTLRNLSMTTDAVCNNNSFTPSDPVDGLVSCNMTYDYTYNNVTDGEKICHDFEAIGSGFVRIKNMVNQNVGPKELYAQTKSNVEKCFRFDFVDPDHCGNNGPPCTESPFDIGPRIQSHRHVDTRFAGYYDPDPESQVTNASGIHQYTIDVHKMQHDYGRKIMYVNMKIEESHAVSAGTEELSFELPDAAHPMMYCLVLITLDLARNYRMARRFVIVDKTSTLQLDYANPIDVLSLDPVTVGWKDHFYNDWHRHTNFLWPILQDDKIDGIFEQTDEPLPVNGTKNVDGIIEFQYGYYKTSPSGDENVPFRPIDDVTSQQAILEDLTVKDGDIVDVFIKGIDIMQHSLADTLRIRVDTSAPTVKNLGLRRNGMKQELVKNVKELSTMELGFHASDLHSGIKQVQWRIGTSHGSSDVGHGDLPVEKIATNTSCLDDPSCYCPVFDVCSFTNFTINLRDVFDLDVAPLTNEYYVWLRVTNTMDLVTTKELTIRMDGSPVSVGIKSKKKMI